MTCRSFCTLFFCVSLVAASFSNHRLDDCRRAVAQDVEHDFNISALPNEAIVFTCGHLKPSNFVLIHNFFTPAELEKLGRDSYHWVEQRLTNFLTFRGESREIDHRESLGYNIVEKTDPVKSGERPTNNINLHIDREGTPDRLASFLAYVESPSSGGHTLFPFLVESPSPHGQQLLQSLSNVLPVPQEIRARNGKVESDLDFRVHETEHPANLIAADMCEEVRKADMSDLPYPFFATAPMPGSAILWWHWKHTPGGMLPADREHHRGWQGWHTVCPVFGDAYRHYLRSFRSFPELNCERGDQVALQDESTVLRRADCKMKERSVASEIALATGGATNALHEYEGTCAAGDVVKAFRRPALARSPSGRSLPFTCEAVPADVLDMDWEACYYRAEVIDIDIDRKLIHVRWEDDSVSDENEVIMSTKWQPEVQVYALNGLPCQPYYEIPIALGQRFLEIRDLVSLPSRPPFRSHEELMATLVAGPLCKVGDVVVVSNISVTFSHTGKEKRMTAEAFGVITDVEPIIGQLVVHIFSKVSVNQTQDLVNVPADQARLGRTGERCDEAGKETVFDNLGVDYLVESDRTRLKAAQYDFQDEPLNPLVAWAIAHEKADGPMLGKPFHYLDVYEGILSQVRERVRRSVPQRPVVVLEMGVRYGGSLMMYRSFFGDDCVILGVDVVQSAELLDRTYVHDETKPIADEVFVGDVQDRSFLRQTVERILGSYGAVDVIIDDASHTELAMINAFEELFFDLLRPKGVYVVEDIDPISAGVAGSPEERGRSHPHTWMDYAKRMTDELSAPSPRDEWQERIMRQVDSVSFHNGMVVVNKRVGLAPRLANAGAVFVVGSKDPRYYVPPFPDPWNIAPSSFEVEQVTTSDGQTTSRIRLPREDRA